MSEMFENKIKVKKFDIFSFIIIILAFGLDRLSKVYVINLIEKNQSELFINDFLNITLNWNTGIAFGLFSFSNEFTYNLFFISSCIVFVTLDVIKSSSASTLLRIS